jgi:capsular exopolysaccharide synthesis family protein
VRQPLPFEEAEAFRMLRTRLRYFATDRELRSLVVTSAVRGEGKSTVARNLASTVTASGSRVLLVEADLHGPTLARDLGLRPAPGLAEALRAGSPVEEAIQPIPVEDRSNGELPGRSLDVLVAGATPPNPSELLESGDMADLLRGLADRYELIIIDTPAAAVLADAIPLMKLADGVIVVGELGRTTLDDAIQLREQLETFDLPVLGVVANRIRGNRRGSRYSYS